MSSQEERRKFKRVAGYDKITYNIIPRGKIKKKLTLDLSAGGIRFIGDDFIPLHSLLKLNVSLKNSPKVISAIAKTVWVKSIFGDERYEIGVEFVEITKEDLALFKSLYE